MFDRERDAAGHSGCDVRRGQPQSGPCREEGAGVGASTSALPVTARPASPSLRQLVAGLESFVASFEEEDYTLSTAKAAFADIVRARNLCETVRLLLMRRVSSLTEDTRQVRAQATNDLANEAGSSLGGAHHDLSVANRLATHPELEDAMRSGELSPAQLSAILPAVEADSSAAPELLEAAKSDSLKELKDKSGRIVASHRSEEESAARLARLHAARRLFIDTCEDGSVRLSGQLAPVEGAAVKNVLEHMAKRLAKEANRSGLCEHWGAYNADALTELCLGARRYFAGGIVPGSKTRPAATADPANDLSVELDEPHDERRSLIPRCEISLHVDVEALRRGQLEPGERCEIAGVGPVPLSTVEYLFGEAWASAIISDGVDVLSVTRLGRTYPVHLDQALRARDRICAVPGCGEETNLERDHLIPVSAGGRTELDNLVMLCRRCHWLKTNRWYQLVREGNRYLWGPQRPGQPMVVERDSLAPALVGDPMVGLAAHTVAPPPWQHRARRNGTTNGSDDTGTATPSGTTNPRQSYVQGTLGCSGRTVRAMIGPFRGDHDTRQGSSGHGSDAGRSSALWQDPLPQPAAQRAPERRSSSAVLSVAVGSLKTVDPSPGEVLRGLRCGRGHPPESFGTPTRASP